MASQAIGIDIGTHAIKIAVLQKKGAVTKATRLYRSKLAGDTDVERIQGALRRAGISGGPGLLGITGRDLIIRYTHVPPVPDWRLKLLMQFEINEVSGQSGGEVAADYSRLELPTDADDTTVLVALCRNSYLQPRLDGVVSAGMRAGGGCPNSVALFNAFLEHGSFEEGETTYIVSLGRDNIDMAVQRDGELLFARNMAGGGGLFTEAIMSTFGLKEGKAETNKIKKGDLTPKAQARYPDATSEKVANAMQGPAGQLVSMVQSTVMICRAQTKIPDLNIDRLVLTGGGARMTGIRAYFQQSMSVPVELFDPVDELDVSGLHPDDASELGEHPLDFSVAIGLAETLLRGTSKKLEVLTESAKKKRHFLERTVWALGAAAAALLLVVVLFQTRAADIAVVEAANNELAQVSNTASNRDDRGKAAAAKELDARLKEVTLRSRRINGGFALAIFELLEKKHPEKYFYIRRIRIEPERV
ncbi:MAG: pilus assembly protein PilM, partial [Planctomycetota bacterium]